LLLLPLHRVVSVHDSQAPQLHVDLSSCSQCPSCRRLLYDEQIMANWSNSDADYKTTCPYCHTRLVASLTITMKQVDSSPPLFFLPSSLLFLLFPPFSLVAGFFWSLWTVACFGILHWYYITPS